MVRASMIRAVLAVVLSVSPLSAFPTVEQSALDCLYDNSCTAASRSAAAVLVNSVEDASRQARPASAGAAASADALNVERPTVSAYAVRPAPEVDNSLSGRMGRGFITGLKEGYDTAEAYTMYPGVTLRVAGMTEESRVKLFSGFLLEALFFIPAIVAGAVGALVGSVYGSIAEAVTPGATDSWCGSCIIDPAVRLLKSH